MRDLLVLGIVLAALPFAIRHTWSAVLLWTWLSLMNPHKLAFGFAYAAPFAAMAACAALLSLLPNRDRFKLPLSPPVIVLVFFVVWMCITTVFAINPGPSWSQLNKVLKIQLMTLIAMIALRERKHIELFIWVNVLSIGFYGIKGGIFTIITGGAGRVWGPPGGFIEGNNEIALALILAIPLMNYLRIVAKRIWIRLGLLAMMVLSVVAAVGTQSRGAFLALLAMGLLLWMRSSRMIATGIGVLTVSVMVIAFMPSTWEDRMGTIQTYELDTSAMGRINAWWVTSKLANSRPTGGGFEIYTPEIFAKYAPDPTDVKVAHSIYFSVLGEHGYVGLFLFMLIWLLSFRLSRRIRIASAKNPDSLWTNQLAAMCQVSLVGYAVGGAFLSLAYFDLPYNILVILVVSMRWLEEKGWNIDTQKSGEVRTPADGIHGQVPGRVNA